MFEFYAFVCHISDKGSPPWIRHRDCNCTCLKAIIVTVQGYGNCSCIADVSTNTSDVSSTAVEGVCDVTSCQTWRLCVFVILFFVAVFIIFFCAILHVSCLLRSNVVPNYSFPLINVIAKCRLEFCFSY